jgi:hypothetical protein
MLSRTGFALVVLILFMPFGITAQNGGHSASFPPSSANRNLASSRSSYLAPARRTTSFKPQNFLASSYRPKKATTSSFAMKKFATSPFLSKERIAQDTNNKASAAPRTSMRQTTYANGRQGYAR